MERGTIYCERLFCHDMVPWKTYIMGMRRSGNQMIIWLQIVLDV